MGGSELDLVLRMVEGSKQRARALANCVTLSDAPRRRTLVDASEPSDPVTARNSQQTRKFLRDSSKHKGSHTSREMMSGAEAPQSHVDDAVFVAPVIYDPLMDTFPADRDSALNEIIRSLDPPLIKFQKCRELMEAERTAYGTWDWGSQRRIADLQMAQLNLVELDPILHHERAAACHSLAVTYAGLKMYPDAIYHAEKAAEDRDFLPRATLLIGVATYLIGDVADSGDHFKRALREHKFHAGCGESHPSCVPYEMALCVHAFEGKNHERGQDHLATLLEMSRHPHAELTSSALISLGMYLVKNNMELLHFKVRKLIDTVGRCVRQGQDAVHELNDCSDLKRRLDKGQDLGPQNEVRVVQTKLKLDLIAQDIQQHVEVVDRDITATCTLLDDLFQFLIEVFNANTACTRASIAAAALFCFFWGSVSWLRNNRGRARVAYMVAGELWTHCGSPTSHFYLCTLKYRSALHFGYGFKDAIRKFDLPFEIVLGEDDLAVEFSFPSGSTEMKKYLRRIIETDEFSEWQDTEQTIEDLDHVVKVCAQSTEITIRSRVELGYVLLGLIRCIESSNSDSTVPGTATQARVDDLLTSASQLYMDMYGEGHHATKSVMQRLHRRLKPVERVALSPKVPNIRMASVLHASCGTTGATIYFKWLGLGWQKYCGSIRPPAVGHQTIELKAVRNGMVDSSVETHKYLVLQ
eukprot:PhM_4_TR11293/c0_g1_i1/m.93262